MRNYPWSDAIKAAEDLANDGHAFYQKFTCEKCNARLTMEQVNTFYTHGKCDQCQHITDIRETGFNYLLVISAIRNSEDRRIKVSIGLQPEKEA